MNPNTKELSLVHTQSYFQQDWLPFSPTGQEVASKFLSVLQCFEWSLTKKCVFHRAVLATRGAKKDKNESRIK